jgi:hypothetical protein
MKLSIGIRKIEDEEQIQADLGERFSLLSMFLTDFMIGPAECDEATDALETQMKDKNRTKLAHFGYNGLGFDTDGETVWVVWDYAEPSDETEELSYADFKKIFAAWRQALIDGRSGYTIEI